MRGKRKFAAKNSPDIHERVDNLEKSELCLDVSLSSDQYNLCMFYTHTSFASEFVYSFQLPTGDEFMTELWVIHIYNFRSIIFYLAQRLCFSPESYNSQGHRFSTLHGILSLSMSEILRLNIEVLLSYFQFGNRFPIVIDNSKLLQIEH